MTTETRESQAILPVLRPISRLSSTPERFKVLLHLPTSQILHQITHNSSHLARDCSPLLREASSRSLRPVSSCLSVLTERENSRLGAKTERGERKREGLGVQKTPKFTKLPEEEDFKRVLDRLHRLTAKGGPQDPHFPLYEGKSSLLVLETNERAYGKLVLKDRKPPVSLQLKRTSGKLVTCLSYTVAEPQEGVCDLQVRGDWVEVAEKGVEFESALLYVGFHALEMASFTVYVHFGRLKASKSSIRPSDESHSADPIPTPRIPALKPVPNTDFIALNMRPSASVERLNRLEEQRSLSVERRKTAKLRHFAHIKGRKEWASLQLRRRELRAEEMAKEQAKIMQFAMKTRAEKGLLVAIVHSQSLLELSSRLIRHCEEVKRAKMQGQMASVIQRIAKRRLFMHRPPTLLSLGTALNHLRLFLAPLRENCAFAVKSNLMAGIRSDYKRAKLSKTFEIFFERVKKVQKAAKMATSVRSYRFKQLNALWTSCLSAMLTSASSKKTHGKGKKGKSQATALLSVPLARKQQALLQHYTAAKRAFGQEFRTYMERKGRGMDPPVPVFTYLPEEASMRRIIEKAAQFPL